jgi:iron complex outermembrane receptor protein
MTSRSILLAAVAASALLAPGSGHAQETSQETAATAPDFATGDIIVTARKREESLQEVPIAITALGAEDIRSARIERLSDVAKLTPGLNFTPLFGNQNQLPIIRGAAQTFGALNVGVFLDGVFLSGKAGVDIELADLERIEVVRGPQSALYGRNTFAGAINYISRRPTAELSGWADASVGDNGLLRFSAAVSGPVSEKIRVKVGGYYRAHDGWYTSAIDGGKVDDAEYYGGMAVVELLPTENITVTWRGSYAHEETGQPPSNVIRTNAFPARPAGSPVGTVRNILFIGELPELPRDGILVNTGRAIVGPGGQTADYGQTQDTYRTNLKIEIDSGPVVFTSLTSFDQRDTDYLFDGDNTICNTPSTAPIASGCPNFGFPFAPGSNIPLGKSDFGTSSLVGYSRDWAQEIRLASQGGGSFDWLVGAYYYDNKSRSVDRSLNPLTVAGAAASGFPQQTTTTKSMAVFGSATWRATEALSLTGELRYENEAQRFRQTPTNGTPSTTVASRRVFDLKENFEFVTPRVIVDYRIDDSKLLYGSVARGVKTGGFNTNINVFDDQRRYSPETSWNYEIGAKTDWVDNRLRLNLAGFYTDWDDQQVACQNPITAGGSSTQRTYVCNVGQAEIYGIEADFVARFGEIFTLTGNYSWTQAKYKAFVDDSLAAALILIGQPPIDFDGKRLPYVPEHKFVLSPKITVPFGDWEAEARTDIVHQSKRYLRADNLQFFAAKTTVDLRLGVQNDHLAFQFFVNNLFDDKTPVAGVRFFDSVNFSVSSPLVQGPERRQIGGSVRYSF